MPKEDRSDWVAVAPEFSSGTGDAKIKKATSAFTYFQKAVTEQVKAQVVAENDGKFDIAAFGKAVQARWQDLDDDEKEPYLTLARQDADRYNREMHMADVAALERRERLQKEREEAFMIDDNIDLTSSSGKRTTRNQREKIQRKKARAMKKIQQADNQEFKDDDDSEASNGSWDDDDNSSTNEVKEKKKPARKVTPKQQEYIERVKKEKQDKDSYIHGRQQQLRKEKADQAKRRLEFLLKQSNIFSHFGRVKEDTAKYGIKAAPVDGSDTKKSRRDAVGSNNDDDEEALEEADEHEATFLTQQPTTLGFGQMRPYQLEGLNWMIRLQEHGVNGILADEMGLGKTLQSISILVYMKEYQNMNGPHLILVPKSTLSNWMNEIKRWAPTIRAIRFHGDKNHRAELVRDVLEPAQRDENREWDVLVTTYEICNMEKGVLKKFAWSYMIIDEAHRLKNEASAFSMTVRAFETRYRILLTGTPLQNSLHELWALLNFLVPDVFESSEQFDEWFNLDIDDNDEKNKLISQLHKILRPFMLRRLKADVETSLPPKHETILFTGMSAMQKKLYRDILSRDIDAISGKSGSRTAILNIVMQLRKCAAHPYLFPGLEDRSLPPLGEHLVESCGKMVVLDKLLRRLHEDGHRVLLFTQMTRVLDIMEDYLVMRRFQYCRIDGNTSYEDREEFIDSYNAPNSEKFIFLLSTRAGGLGINLQTADIVILYDSDWNPQADLQAQDRAHRIGQKRPVQVFRLVTEHTIEEKIVERAQQKLKLDAMVVQQGRLKDKDKLSRDELLMAVRFGADKIFKSNDSSITDADIDDILNQGKQKTAQLNEKLQTADKGDLLDFKFDGSSVQTFEGIDYSVSALAQAKAQAEMLGIFDIGKRERKEASYNETDLYKKQMAALHGPNKPKKRKEFRLPKHLRLPRMDEWQMYDRERLSEIQQMEENKFKELPEEEQKLATMADKVPTVETEKQEESYVLPPLLTEELQKEKDMLLNEGFNDWNRLDYQAFWKASARYGRTDINKIAIEVGKSAEDVKKYADAFWGEKGKKLIAEHEYERVTKFIERGEKKIDELHGLERGTRVLVSLFDNPWKELVFTYVNCKDKMFTEQEDRHLLCWARKYGYGQWNAVRMAIRRNPLFRFNYFMRSLPLDLVSRRCEQLMKAAEKEVEQIEQYVREMRGLPSKPENEGDELPPVELPKFKVLQRQIQQTKKKQSESEKKVLVDKIEEVEAEISRLQGRLKAINSGNLLSLSTPYEDEKTEPVNTKRETSIDTTGTSDTVEKEDDNDEEERDDGATGPDGNFLLFPEYTGNEAPTDCKKAFTHFCNHTRKQVKAELGPSERKNKATVNSILKERWVNLSPEDKQPWKAWAIWDKKRHTREMTVFQNRRADDMNVDEYDEFEKDGTQNLHVPKKKRKNDSATPTIPKKKRS